MSKPKLYFRKEDSTWCHTTDYFRSDIMDEGVTEMQVYEAIPDKSKEYFWCGAVDEAYIQGEGSCGRDCDSYTPCNGKSGKCKFKTYCYIHGDLVTIKMKGAEK